MNYKISLAIVAIVTNFLSSCKKQENSKVNNSKIPEEWKAVLPVINERLQTELDPSKLVYDAKSDLLFYGDIGFSKDIANNNKDNNVQEENGTL